MLSKDRAAVRETIFERYYPILLLSLWVFAPEVRRVVDWRVGFNSLSVINVIPLAALIPLAFVALRGGLTGISLGFRIVASIWLTAFGYGLLVGFLSGRLLGAVYECSLYLLPPLVGIWLAKMDAEKARRSFRRFTDATIFLSVAVSLYGIYQYVAPPAWDIYWMANSGLTSIGNPAPFEVRVFSTLNSPLTCADFLAITLLLMLHRLRIKSLWIVAPLFLSITAMIVTLVRTAWIEVAAGVVIYLCLSPRRALVFGSSVISLAATILIAMNLGTITGNVQVANLVQDRLSTLSNLGSDGSTEVREYGTAQTIGEAFEEPLGQGLGFGSGAKLSGGSTATAAQTASTENGYAMRMLEMGLFGAAFYVLAIALAVGFSFVYLRRFINERNLESAVYLATGLTIQLALIGAELSADDHLSLMGIFYWLVIGFGSALAKETRPELTLSASSLRTAGAPLRA